MKHINIFILFLFLGINLHCQNEPWLFSSLDEKEILSRLFDDARLVHTSDNKLMARWKPNFAERMAFPVSYDDDMCYTEIDTVLRFSKSEDEYALFVFATYEMTENGKERSSGCHACAPMLSTALFTENLNGNKGWSILNFKKEFGSHGSWGEIGAVELVQIGKKEFALSLGGDYMAQGFYSGGFTYYELMNYLPVFSVSTFSENSGAGLDEDETFGFETSVEILPGADEYYRIRCTTEGTDYIFKQNKKVSVDGVKTFVFDEGEGKYVEEKR